MQSDLKYLGIGLGIGVGATALIIIAVFFAGTFSPAPLAAPNAENVTLPMQPSNTLLPPPTFTSTLEATSTPTLTPTNIPAILSTQFNIPTATSTSLFNATQLMIDAGQLTVIGPLSEAQIRKLYEVSQSYVEPTTRGSLYRSKEINGVKYGNASNTCGPLAIAILRDAGILDQNVLPHDFWLLDPDVPLNRKLLNNTFSNDRFVHTSTKNPVTRIDWKAFPLEPGDFIYIEAGTGGNFDHMLTVTRVDKYSRVYSVTNYQTASGFIIAEAMLYDPNDPNVGLFHTWTQRPNQPLGSTGFGGFEVWRPRAAQ